MAFDSLPPNGKSFPIFWDAFPKLDCHNCQGGNNIISSFLLHTLSLTFCAFVYLLA